jgi:hypothetical protein
MQLYTYLLGGTDSDRIRIITCFARWLIKMHSVTYWFQNPLKSVISYFHWRWNWKLGQLENWVFSDLVKPGLLCFYCMQLIQRLDLFVQRWGSKCLSVLWDGIHFLSVMTCGIFRQHTGLVFRNGFSVRRPVARSIAALWWARKNCDSLYLRLCFDLCTPNNPYLSSIDQIYCSFDWVLQPFKSWVRQLESL